MIFRYVTREGQQRDETAKLVTLNGKSFYRVTGRYQYTYYGNVITINYKADENGYKASSVLRKLQVIPKISTLLLGSLVGGGLG